MTTEHLAEHPIQRDELMAYLDGELPPDRARAAVAHLERCPECQAFAAELQDVSRQLLVWEIEALDAQMPTKIVAALDEREPKANQSKVAAPIREKGILTRRWAWAGAFAAVCVLVGVGVIVPGLHRARQREAVSTSLVEPSGVRGGGGGGGYAAQTRKDSNGLFHGLGDDDANSISHDGQPLIDQDSELAGKSRKYKAWLEPSDSAPQTSGPMIVRTAGITITTKDFDGARAALDQILKRHHGYVGEMNVSTPTGSGRSVTATLRVPADQLDAAMSDLRKLGRIESESQSGQEVTAQYVDLQARLANARNTEQRLTDLLRQRTGKLSDVLAVETEIDRVRGVIEQMEAERKNLAGQVNFATINATVGEDYKAELQVVPVTTSSRIRNAAVDGYRRMVDGVIGVVLFLFSYGPSLLLWGAILFFPARLAWRRVRQLGGKVFD